jgi:hypothetical protein
MPEVVIAADPVAGFPDWRSPAPAKGRISDAMNRNGTAKSVCLNAGVCERRIFMTFPPKT